MRPKLHKLRDIGVTMRIMKPGALTKILVNAQRFNIKIVSKSINLLQLSIVWLDNIVSFSGAEIKQLSALPPVI